MSEVSIFLDESGSDNLRDKYYLLTLVLHRAMDYALAREAVRYRVATASDYRLSQAADYICTMELTALKYQDKTSTATDEKFFGSWTQFKKGILKEIRAKRI